MNKECAPGAGVLMPGEQFGLVGMGGKSIDCVDAGVNRDILAEDTDLFRAVDNAASKRAGSGVADKHDTRLRS